MVVHEAFWVTGIDHRDRSRQGRAGRKDKAPDTARWDFRVTSVVQ